MAVRRLQYSQEYEKVYAATGSHEKAHTAASKKSMVKRIPKVKKLILPKRTFKKSIKKKKSTWVSRMKRNVQMLLKGPKYYESLKKKGKK